MTGPAILLVVTAAFAHALWNLYAKRAGAAGVTFIWLYTAVAAVLYAPLGWWQLATSDVALTLPELGFIGGSVLLHLAYFMLLQRGYSVGDLSLVYPVARGLGPVLAIVGAVAILGERPSPRALLGGLLICTAIVGLGIASWAATSRARAGGPTSAAHPALAYACLTGVVIACYTLWDAHAVGSLEIPPLVFLWLGEIGRVAGLTPVALRRRSELRAVWHEHRRPIMAVAVLSPLAYILVLIAFTMAPVSYVAPLRELSIVIGALLGAKLLGEAQGYPRVVAAVAIVGGGLLIALPS